MGYAIGTVTKAGGGDVDAHYQTLEVIKTLAEANGWTTLRYDTTKPEREWIARGVGLSGTEQIFIGIRTYQNVAGDYYNLLAGTFVGYVAGNTFDTQPGAKLSGIPAHNNAVTYYLNINAARILMMLKVGALVYVHGYIGKFLPYARPSEFPTPLLCAGAFNGAELKRFSASGIVFPYQGNTVSSGSNLYLRRPDGSWYAPAVWPFTHGSATDSDARSTCLAGHVNQSCQVPNGDSYQLESLIMCDSVNVIEPANVWGELDGVYYCSGFNNGSENVIQQGGSSVIDQAGKTVLQTVQEIKAAGGRAFIVGQSTIWTTWRDYVALEM